MPPDNVVTCSQPKVMLKIQIEGTHRLPLGGCHGPVKIDLERGVRSLREVVLPAGQCIPTREIPEAAYNGVKWWLERCLLAKLRSRTLMVSNLCGNLHATYPIHQRSPDRSCRRSCHGSSICYKSGSVLSGQSGRRSAP